ncbi:hypothetical protein O181_105485 [Austropuccinia psidii MF-1]|uniref:Reverse transcriptase domain-containing protein n=1 Tax=Austropuccinia psidii MF-1 TaxID=1389203 RepID=A0A9Q3JLR1_9BASI|nr:hypothetical protein [Austropuccinia psidii MF-1]
MVQMKVLKKCGGELEHALRRRCIEPCSTEEYINALEDIVTRAKIGRTWKKLDIKSPNKPFIKNDKPREPFKPNTSKSNEKRKCHRCGEESDSEKDNEQSKASESDEINIINAQTNNIDLIYEVLDVNSNLPQVGTSDTSLKNMEDANIYRTKPAKGMGYTAGKSSISIFMVENQEAKVNLDTGEYCTCVEPLGAIIGNEVDIILNVEKPYPPLLRRTAYPASPRARQALEVQIKELMDLEELRKVENNEKVEVTTPVIITWHNGKSRMVEYFRALNTYTIPDRYPIPRIHDKLTQLSQARFITAMDALKGFHQNLLTDNAKRLLRIIVHCGIFEYLRLPFGIKNAPSHY